jgi:hypothetical protein
MILLLILTVSYRVNGSVQSLKGVFLLPQMDGETSDSRSLVLPNIFIDQDGSNKVIDLQASLSSAYWRGTVVIDQCELVAIPIN